MAVRSNTLGYGRRIGRGRDRWVQRREGIEDCEVAGEQLLVGWDVERGPIVNLRVLVRIDCGHSGAFRICAYPYQHILEASYTFLVSSLHHEAVGLLDSGPGNHDADFTCRKHASLSQYGFQILGLRVVNSRKHVQVAVGVYFSPGSVYMYTPIVL